MKYPLSPQYEKELTDAIFYDGILGSSIEFYGAIAREYLYNKNASEVVSKAINSETMRILLYKTKEDIVDRRVKLLWQLLINKDEEKLKKIFTEH